MRVIVIMSTLRRTGSGSSARCAVAVCTSFIKHPDQDEIASQETRVALLPYLTKWMILDDGQTFGDISQRTVFYLRKDPKLIEATNHVRQLYENWDVCGLPNTDYFVLIYLDAVRRDTYMSSIIPSSSISETADLYLFHVQNINLHTGSIRLPYHKSWYLYHATKY